ncbi:MAG: helix-turn-helix transcriptional regulator [Lachnospiraceae bacterium]|nr:helix-turn-helix transcriptional regulator [Lachnospiraceae bacterium]
MNEIMIAAVLAKKRQEKGIKQEELAEYIGVSKAAVSKWEKGQSFPDITLLPQLAAYFNISIDELFSYAPQLSREDIHKLCVKLSAEFATKPLAEVMVEYRGIIKKYYSCFALLYHMAVLLLNHSLSVTADEEREELINKAKSLCKRVAVESNNPQLAKQALNVQCFCCLLLKEAEEVFSLLGESLHHGNIAEDKLISEAFALTGNTEKAKEISQCGIYEHLIQLVTSLLTYVGLTYENSFEVARTAHDRLMGLVCLFNLTDLDVNETANTYLLGAEIYCRQGMYEKTFEFLELYTDLCLTFTFPLKIKGDSFFSAVDNWLESSELGSTIPYNEKMLKQRMIESMLALPSLSVLHDQPRYLALLQKLHDNANQ